MNGIVCTCDALDTASPAHEPTCPMVTGVPVDGDTFTAELRTLEPPMATCLRHRLDGRFVTAHLIDGSVLMGQVTAVADDGTIATIEGQEETWDFDVASVCVLSTRRSSIAKNR